MTRRRTPSLTGPGMRGVRKAFDRILTTACVVLFAILVVTVSWQVFTRQVLNDPSEWSEELAKYVFVWLGMFGATLLFAERGHIAVDVVVRRFPHHVQRAVAVVVQLAVLVFSALALVWGGTRLTGLAWGQSLTALPAHLGIVYVVMPITGVIIIFYVLYHIASILRGEAAPIEADDTAEEV